MAERPEEIDERSRGDFVSLNYTLDSYIEEYSDGIVKILRLEYISKQYPQWKEEALVKAINLTKSLSFDVSLYERLRNQLAETAGEHPAATNDIQWVSDTKSKVTTSLNRLEMDLQRYSNNLLTQSTIETLADMALHHIKSGNYISAIKNLHSQRDQLNIQEDIIKVNLQIADCELLRQDWTQVIAYANKVILAAEELSSRGNRPPSFIHNLMNWVTRSHVLLGLGYIKLGNFALAASSFLKIGLSGDGSSIVGGSGYADIASEGDISTYIAICALVSFDRPLLRYLVDKDPIFSTVSTFRLYSRDLISSYLTMNFKGFFELLAKYFPEMQLDLFLSSRLPYIKVAILRKALRQYLSVFSTVELSKVAETFGYSKEELIEEIRVMTLSPEQIQTEHDVPISNQEPLDVLIDVANNVSYRKLSSLYPF